MTNKHPKTIRILWFIPLALITLLFGCDLFLASEKPRDNPLDPSNPTSAVSELKAYGFSANSVKLQWKFESSGESEYPSVMIVRNSVQEPTSTNDGTLVYSGPTTIAEGDEYAEYTDDEVAEESDYYYGIWAYTEQDGTIYYNGPISDTATTTLNEVELSPTWDGYLWWDSMPTCWIDDTMSELHLWWDDTVTEEYILLAFDFENTPDFGQLSEAGLRLYKYGDSGISDWQVSAARITQEWDPGDDPYNIHDKIVFNGFQDFSDDADAPVIDITLGSTGYYYWDMSDAITAWLVEGEPNYGILVRSRTNDMMGAYDFYASEHGTDSEQPKLILKYYGDSPDEGNN